MEDVLMGMQLYFQRTFEGGNLSRRMMAIINVLNTKEFFSEEGLKNIKNDFEDLKDIYLESLKKIGAVDPSLEKAFSKIREGLEKVKVRE